MLTTRRFTSVLAALAIATDTACESSDSANAPASSDAPTTTTLDSTTGSDDLSTSPRATTTTDPVRSPSVLSYSALTEVSDAVLVDDVSEAVGDPDADTGWIPMPVAYACTGAGEYRSLLCGMTSASF